MPNIWTHILFSEDVLDTVRGPHRFSPNETIMKLGAQGPNPFFYYNFWPWITDNEPVHLIGEILHKKHCGDFIMDLITSAKSKNGQVRAYVFGFVTHHLLDRNTVPYIQYHAGLEESSQQKFAINIDTLMMKRFHNLKTWKAPAYKEIDVGFRIKTEIVHLLCKLINKYYPEVDMKSPAYIQKAYRDMKLALRLLSDPYGWKSKLFKSYVSTFSHQPIKDEFDYLNLQEATWRHPETNEASTKSFIELYEDARAEGLEIMTEILNYWDSDDDTGVEKLSQLIGNISYETGMPLPS